MLEEHTHTYTHTHTHSTTRDASHDKHNKSKRSTTLWVIVRFYNSINAPHPISIQHADNREFAALLV